MWHFYNCFPFQSHKSVAFTFTKRFINVIPVFTLCGLSVIEFLKSTGVLHANIHDGLRGNLLPIVDRTPYKDSEVKQYKNSIV